MNVIAEIQRINQAELENGSVGTSASWHAKYADTAWVFVGNLPMQLTEGDVICVMSQFGEVEDINLVRDEDTGKSKGFAFMKYEDSRSCILAVDNLTGSKVLGRSIRVDHVENYRLPKHLAERENGQNNGNDLQASNIEKTAPGHAYQGQELASSFDISKGQDLFAGPTVEESKADGEGINPNGEEGMSKEERRQAKQARKEARDQKRRDKEQRRMRKEEKRRERRARHMKGGGKEGGSTSRSSDDDDEYEHDGSSGARRRSESSKTDRKSKKKHRRPSTSRSRSYDRYSSDGRSSSSHGSARKRRRRRTEGGIAKIKR